MEKRINRIIQFILKWNELLTIPLAFVLWWMSAPFLRAMDPTAGVYDAGIFQIILFAVIAFLIFQAMAWITLKLSFPKVYKWLDDELGNHLNNSSLSTWEKSKIVLWLFSLFLLALVFLARVI